MSQDYRHLSMKKHSELDAIVALCSKCANTETISLKVFPAALRKQLRFRDRHVRCVPANEPRRPGRVETDDARSVA